MTSTNGVKLYSYHRSSASWRVRIALAHKGITYDYAPVNLLEGAQFGDAYTGVNPLRAVPSLEIDGVTISESLAIIQYLDETRPEPPLFPKDAATRAQVRRFAEAINAGIQPMQNLRVLRRLESEFGQGEDGKKKWAAHFIALGFEGLERFAKVHAGRYAFGDVVTLADVCLVPQFHGARRFGVDLAPFPTLVRIEAALVTLPAFVAAVPEAQPDAPKAK